MSESSEQHAPELGTPTDSDVGDAALAKSQSDDAEMAKTMETPDDLGGTGGEQAGGAG